MNTWITRHMQTLVGTLGRLWQQRLQSALTIFVIGIALALPACLQVFVINARVLGGSIGQSVEVSVYLRAATTVSQADALANQLRGRSDVAKVDLIKADDALADFRKHSGFGEALDALQGNPLPHALVIQPVEASRGRSQLEALAADIKQLPEVEIVQLDTVWVERFNAILATIGRTTWLVAALLALGVAVIVGNVIRADIQSRRAEIEITKLIGGSDAFVRRPFLYSGVWYGIGGGVVGLLLTALVVILLDGPIAKLATLYGSEFRLVGLSLRDSASLFIGGIALGWLGSWLSATRHLREIEPS
jgi:cell division transport system permease protein